MKNVLFQPIDFSVKIAFFFRLLICSVCFFCFSSSLWSQQVFVASGGATSGSGGSVSFSLGQVFYTEALGTGGHAFQGIQITYEIYVVSGIEETNQVQLNYMVFPNPVDEYLVLRIDHFPIENIFSNYTMLTDGSSERQKSTGKRRSCLLGNIGQAVIFLE